MSHKPVFHKLYLNPLFRGNRAFSNRTADYAWQYLPDPHRQLCEIIYIQEGSISEPKYLSRLFRQYTGMTAREYKRTYSERWNSGH